MPARRPKTDSRHHWSPDCRCLKTGWLLLPGALGNNNRAPFRNPAGLEIALYYSPLEGAILSRRVGLCEETLPEGSKMLVDTQSATVALPVPQPALTPVGHDEIRGQLDRILSSAVFGTSKRYPAFLRFVVETTLDGHSECLKERTIGVDVFNRPADYDTNSDHVVRSAAGEVRRRLAQYYVQPGHAAEIQIDLPLGSYVPQFRRPVTELPTVKTTVEPAREAISNVPVSLWKVSLWKKYRLIALALPLAVSLFFALRAASALGRTELDKFWNPVFASAPSKPVLICIGSRFGGSSFRPSTGAPGQQQAADPNRANNNDQFDSNPLMRPVTMTDAVTLARLTDYMGTRRAPYKVLNPDLTTLADLRDSPAVLIGSRNNDWAIKSAGTLRFRFDVSSRPASIRDNMNPSRTWSSPLGFRIGDSGRDYAIVSRVVDPGVEQVIVTVAGLGPSGTLAAGEFVTNETYMKKLEALAPYGWEHKNLQVVISTEVVKGSSGPPRIDTAYFW